LLLYLDQYDQWKPGAHTGTFRGNQIALVSGAATLEFIKKEGLLEHVKVVGEQLRQGLLQLQKRYPCIGDVRGRGLMLGMEMIEPDGSVDALGHPHAAGAIAASVKRACLNEGLIIETGGRHGAVLRFLPPLVITSSEVDLVVERLDRALASQMVSSTQVTKVTRHAEVQA
jgi:diaminobutyrate-2-oxoglutarate transaminase